MLRQEMNR